jgi:hypothetical protein
MKVFILGVGKSGTTALTYKVADGLPNCEAFSGGKPGKYLGNYENAVYKHTYEERKGKSFEIYQQHLGEVSYDRYIWIARDPRDSAVSRMLYRWHRGYKGKKAQFQAHLDLVLKKEQDPRSIPFYEICRYTGHNDWPISKEAVVEEERIRCERMSDFVKNLGDEWFIFKFEDMVANKYDALNAYLGFEVQADTEVPVSTGKAKVIRKKASGDWRHWFTAEDVAAYKAAYLPYLEAIGYDTDDWELSPKPVIEPEYSSVYMQNLPRKNKMNLVRSVKDVVQRRFKSGA